MSPTSWLEPQPAADEPCLPTADIAGPLSDEWLQVGLQLQALSRQAETLLARMVPSTPWGCIPAQEALVRLVRASGSPLDQRLLGVPVLGSRVVLATCITTDRRLVESLLEGQAQLSVWLDRTTLLTLVRNVPRSVGEDRALLDARRLARLLEASDRGLLIGISARIAEAGEVAHAVTDARDAICATRDRGGRVASVDECWADITLERLGRVLHQALTVGNPLTRLVEHDEQGGSELLPTLMAWLSVGRDTPRAAASMHVHRNTLRYRLQRAAEMGGLDLKDPVQGLVAELVSRAWSHFGVAADAPPR